MKVRLAKRENSAATLLSFQRQFQNTTKCAYCKGEARLGFVAHELHNKPKDPAVCHIFDNKPKTEGYWLHDLCAVALYFCRKCLKPTALYNQA